MAFKGHTLHSLHPSLSSHPHPPPSPQPPTEILLWCCFFKHSILRHSLLLSAINLTSASPRGVELSPRIPREQTSHLNWRLRLRQSGCGHVEPSWQCRSFLLLDRDSKLLHSYLVCMWTGVGIKYGLLTMDWIMDLTTFTYPTFHPAGSEWPTNSPQKKAM